MNAIRIGRLALSVYQNNWFRKLGSKVVTKEIISPLMKLLDVLSDEEEKILYQLVENYVYLTSNDIEELYLEAINKVSIERYGQYDSIIVVSANMKKAISKSGDYSSYKVFALLERVIGMNPIEVRIDRLSFRGAIAEVNTNEPEKRLLILTDDFVGTGSTMTDSLAYLEAQIIHKCDIVCLACATMEEGERALMELGAEFNVGMVMKKAISDSAIFKNSNQVISVMIDLGAKIVEDEQYILGFGESESIITLTRTPDNTLPVFWSVKEVEGSKWPAPFPRLDL